MWGLFGSPIDKMTNNTKKLLAKSHKKNQINLDVNATKLPQPNDTKRSSTTLFNDKAQKSLFKINLLIKRFLFSYDPKKIDYINETIPDANNSRHIINGSNYKCKTKKKSMKELYREAAELLGIYCTLSDDCRCIECQSNYFDCHDSYYYEDNDMDSDDFDLVDEDDNLANCYLIHTSQMCECFITEPQQQQILKPQNNAEDSSVLTSINDYGYDVIN